MTTNSLPTHAPRKPDVSRLIKAIPYNILVWGLLILYLMPLGSMVFTALMPTEQLDARNAPLYPAKIQQYEYEGKVHQLYQVPTNEGLKHWVLIHPGPKSSEFLDPQNPDAGLISWEGSWRQLTGVYEFSPTWENFLILFNSLPFPQMVGNTFLMTLIGEIGVVISSILVAYGFARFRLPGGNLLFYVLIATILIPEKITFIPSYFFFVRILNWKDTLYPILLPLFFGNAVYIFLLRQNFRSVPFELEEAAMLDGAGPIRRLFSIILPQSWPVITTITLLHFFYSWNETRLASLYLSRGSILAPVSFSIQNYPQSLIRIDNVIQAGTIVALIVPIFILLQSQKYFMQGLVITGTEK